MYRHVPQKKRPVYIPGIPFGNVEGQQKECHKDAKWSQSTHDTIHNFGKDYLDIHKDARVPGRVTSYISKSQKKGNSY